jgi:hypothetical protein
MPGRRGCCHVLSDPTPKKDGNGLGTHFDDVNNFLSVFLSGGMTVFDFRGSASLPLHCCEYEHRGTVESGERRVSGVLGMGIVWEQHVGLGWTGV